jgi:hypothetical protein
MMTKQLPWFSAKDGEFPQGRGVDFLPWQVLGKCCL